MKIFVVDKRPNFRWRCRGPCISFFHNTRSRPLLLFGISLSQLEKPRVQSPLLAQWSQIMLQDTGWFMAAPAHSHQHWTLIITGDRVCCIKSSEIKSQWNPFTMTFSSDQGSLDSHCPRGTKVAVTTKHSFHPQKQTLLVPAGQVDVVTGCPGYLVFIVCRIKSSHCEFSHFLWNSLF